MTINRRRLLAGASGVGVSALAWRTWAAAGVAVDGPPVARIAPAVETLHGVVVTDPYRWMEDLKSPEWTAYATAQNAFARKVLVAIPGRDALAKRIDAMTSTLAVVQAAQAAGPYIFTQTRPAGANTAKLFVREGVEGEDRLLIDPDLQAGKDTHFSLDYWQVSPSGKYVAYGLSPAGSERSVLRILETASGKVLADAVDNAQFGPPSWLPDETGVFINVLKAGTKPGDADHYEDSVLWLHRLGSGAQPGVKVMARGLDPAVPMVSIDAPLILSAPKSSAVLGVIQSGVQNEVTAYTSPVSAVVAGKPVWTPVCTPADSVTATALMGDDLYLLTHKDAPRFRVLKTSATKPSLANATEVIEQTEMVLKGIAAASDGLYVQGLSAGLGVLLRVASDSGIVTRIDLPFQGSISGLYADPLTEGCWFFLDSWARPLELCRVEADGTVTRTDIAPKPPFDTSVYDNAEVMITARDGVRVPLSIIWKRGTRRDGTAPCYLQAYGAYGSDVDPFFNPRALAWLDLGGIWATAHVRGGGELGEDWHLAGKGATKPNTWRDAIDCAEYLIAQKWTSKTKLSVEGTSAGGIMVGRFITERPDLAAVAIIRVGDSNAMRSETMESGAGNVPEFGTVKDTAGFKALLEMDAYQHVRDKTHYPAVMLTTGLQDPRVAPWQAGKMTARLQAATSSRRPVIMRVETDAGHGHGSTRAQRDAEAADTYAFILWQTGDPRFQPK